MSACVPACVGGVRRPQATRRVWTSPPSPPVWAKRARRAAAAAQPQQPAVAARAVAALAAVAVPRRRLQAATTTLATAPGRRRPPPPPPRGACLPEAGCSCCGLGPSGLVLGTGGVVDGAMGSQARSTARARCTARRHFTSPALFPQLPRRIAASAPPITCSLAHTYTPGIGRYPIVTPTPSFF